MTDASWAFGDPYAYAERLRQGFPPVMVTCALNGGVQGRESHPRLPEHPEELAEAALEAYEAGASIVHVHARDPENRAAPARQAEEFFEVNRLIRERCPDIVINNTTGGGPALTMEDRYRCLMAGPELASLNMGPDMSRFRLPPRPAPIEHPHDGQVFDECIPFTYGVIGRLAEQMLSLGVKPEMEMYQPGQFWVSRDLIERELLKPPYLHQFVMGYQTSSYATLDNLHLLVRHLPPGSIFFCAGVGIHQLQMTTASLLMGGHVRVGLEDNLYARRGQKWAGNGEAVERIVRIARELNRDIATPAQTREMLGISATPSVYDELPAAATG